MNAKVESEEFKLDWLKWIAAFIIITFGLMIWSNAVPYLPAIESNLFRVLIMSTTAIVALLISVQTRKGNGLWVLVKDARVEMRRVVWPTRTETVQTTGIVLVVVFIVALMLWGMDSLLSLIVKGIIG